MATKSNSQSSVNKTVSKTNTNVSKSNSKIKRTEDDNTTELNIAKSNQSDSKQSVSNSKHSVADSKHSVAESKHSVAESKHSVADSKQSVSNSKHSAADSKRSNLKSVNSDVKQSEQVRGQAAEPSERNSEAHSQSSKASSKVKLDEANLSRNGTSNSAGSNIKNEDEKGKALTEPVKPTYRIEERGVKYTLSYAVYFATPCKYVSPLHDIPMYVNMKGKLLNMIVEIPRWSNAKMEISKKDILNPIKQNTSGKIMRYVANMFPFHGYPWNYGAIPQSYISSDYVEPITKLKGDGDALDAIDIGSKLHSTGDVVVVKVIGVLGLIDQEEIDWKLITIDAEDKNAAELNTIDDIDRLFPRLLDYTKVWFEMYKVPETMKQNKLFAGGQVRGSDMAMSIVEDAHRQWRELISSENPTKGISLANSTFPESIAYLSDEVSYSIIKSTAMNFEAINIPEDAQRWIPMPSTDFDKLKEN